MQVPEYLKESYGPYITGGYRRELSFRAALLTLFRVHNESVNIWISSLATRMLLPLGWIGTSAHDPLCRVFLGSCQCQEGDIADTSADELRLCGRIAF